MADNIPAPTPVETAPVVEAAVAVDAVTAPIAVEAEAVATPAEAPKVRKARVVKAKTVKVKADKVKVSKPAAATVPSTSRKAKAAIKPAAAAPSARKTPKQAKPAVKPAQIKKETPMTTAKSKTTDFTATLKGVFADVQAKTKEAYGKSAASVAEAGDFAKGNVEAVVASGKILTDGVKALGASYVAEGKKAYETFTADAKELAAIKSPTDFFTFQSKIMQRNFDNFVALSSKNSEAAVKLVNDSLAPISSRVSLAVDKIKKAA